MKSVEGKEKEKEFKKVNYDIIMKSVEGKEKEKEFKKVNYNIIIRQA